MSFVSSLEKIAVGKKEKSPSKKNSNLKGYKNKRERKRVKSRLDKILHKFKQPESDK